MGLFSGDSENIYNEEMTMSRFQENYDQIVEDLDNNPENAAKAFANVSSDRPDDIRQNAKKLYSLRKSGNPVVRMNVMIALVSADCEIGGGILEEGAVRYLTFTG